MTRSTKGASRLSLINHGSPHSSSRGFRLYNNCLFEVQQLHVLHFPEKVVHTCVCVVSCIYADRSNISLSVFDCKKSDSGFLPLSLRL